MQDIPDAPIPELFVITTAKLFKPRWLQPPGTGTTALIFVKR